MKAEILLCSNMTIPMPLPQMLLAYCAQQDLGDPKEIRFKIVTERSSNPNGWGF